MWAIRVPCFVPEREKHTRGVMSSRYMYHIAGVSERHIDDTTSAHCETALCEHQEVKLLMFKKLLRRLSPSPSLTQNTDKVNIRRRHKLGANTFP
ncbi:hypothetical protein E2C01_041740 [Portunus trituberculatus]|uniref:Uncharacterized protein n=1 Tax=Portunus trituberculatus TaxID=210409 RepID=A0A5B7FRT8_PORTR|nr:hypothetical protein [Portunus trituberculatus]